MDTDVLDEREPVAAGSVDAIAYFHRWLNAVSQDCPQIPQALLRLYFEVDGGPSPATIAETFGCARDQAEQWHAVLQAFLVPPLTYEGLFDVEAALTDARTAWQDHHEEVRGFQTRLHELTAEIVQLDGEKHLNRTAAEKAAINERTAQFDQERETVTRRLQDMPAAAAQYEAALQDATSTWTRPSRSCTRRGSSSSRRSKMPGSRPPGGSCPRC